MLTRYLSYQLGHSINVILAIIINTKRHAAIDFPNDCNNTALVQKTYYKH